ncbi:Abi-alpha family protein [Botrimarina mediterranea]|uniref:Abi-alpha family protein n=1 Tax=Botrimarina mediterranea TaxID=2528022 RepID=UPI0011898700|nr:hypothetical protein K2D_12340 [Planctomycetes bacterium K2D]
MADQGSNGKPLIGDLAGIGEIVQSPLAKQAYDDGLSPAMRQVGALSEDCLKTFRLFTAPLQLAAAYHDRFSRFCDRVREKVPEEHQQDAAAEIARPVMEAFESTSDDSPLMDMFEELMANAIDGRVADSLSPEFPAIIKSLSPFEARLIRDLTNHEQTTYFVISTRLNRISQWLDSDIDYDKYGGELHYLTLSQSLKAKNLANVKELRCQDAKQRFPNAVVSDGYAIKEMIVTLSMYGRWFAQACVQHG